MPELVLDPGEFAEKNDVRRAWRMIGQQGEPFLIRSFRFLEARERGEGAREIQVVERKPGIVRAA